MSQSPPSAGKFPISFVAGLLSYLVPGLGQIYQRRYGKGLMFMVCLLGMFIGGQAMGNWMNVYVPKTMPPLDENPMVRQSPSLLRDLMQRWHYGGQFWIGIAAWPALWQYNNLPVPSVEQSPFWHNFQKMPPEGEQNDYLVTQDKGPDLAWVYTVVAGILNILVIYDAFAGPALGIDEDSPR